VVVVLSPKKMCICNKGVRKLIQGY